MNTKPMIQLISCQEVEIHYKRPVFNSLTQIKSSGDVDSLLRSYINLNRIDLKEFFWVILLTNANRVIGISEIGSGTPKGVTTNIQEIWQLIILSNAQAFCIAHNHPSGSLKPSKSDQCITQKLKQISKLFDITLLDHLIITSEGYYSFSDSSIL